MSNEVILNEEDLSLMLHLVSKEIFAIGANMPKGSNLPKLYEKLLDICELEKDIEK